MTCSPGRKASRDQIALARIQEDAAARKDVNAFVTTLAQVADQQKIVNAAAEALNAASCVSE